MNQESRDSIFIESVRNFKKSHEHTEGFKIDALKSRLIEINFFLDTNGNQTSELVRDMTNVYDALSILLKNRLNYYFLHLLINDSIPRLRRVALILQKNFEKHSETSSQKHLYDIGRFLKFKIEEQPIGQDAWKQSHKAQTFKGIQEALKCLIKSLLISNRSRWIILTAIESNYFEKDSDILKTIPSLIRKTMQDDKIIFAENILDSDDLSDIFLTPNPLPILKAEECLKITHAYSRACKNESRENDIDKFPSFKKRILEETQSILLALYDQNFEISKIKNYLEGTLKLKSHSSFTFIYPQNSVKPKSL